ncbi:MAG: DUF2911 domain-containing protein [Gelidibacter sp.]
MKKNILVSTITFAFIILLSFDAAAQDFPDLDISPMDAATFPGNYKVSDKLIKVVYSRPQLKGRTLSKLAPNDEVWRTGANEAAEITFYDSVMFGNTKIKPGSYSLFTIPGEKEWTIILSSNLNVWGAFTYDKANDVARLKVPVRKGKKPIEAFSIVFDESKTGATMYLGWADVVIAVPFNVL